MTLTRRGFLYLALPITPCALTFPSLETSCKPRRRRETYIYLDLFTRNKLSNTKYPKQCYTDSKVYSCCHAYLHLRFCIYNNYSPKAR